MLTPIEGKKETFVNMYFRMPVELYKRFMALLESKSRYVSQRSVLNKFVAEGIEREEKENKEKQEKR